MATIPSEIEAGPTVLAVKGPIPSRFEKALRRVMPRQMVDFVFGEIVVQLQGDIPKAKPPIRGYTYGGDENVAGSQYQSFMKDTYPDDEFGYDTIDEMLKTGQVRFALELKKAAILSALFNELQWQIQCQNETLGKVVKADMERIFATYGPEMLTMLEYGSFFGELIWEYVPASARGLKGSGKWWVLEGINAVKPETVDYIRRVSKGPNTGRFDGFTQEASSPWPEHTVPVEQALILTFRKKWRNLWGESILKPAYPLWYWWNLILASFIHYLDKAGDPLVVAKAPMRGRMKRADDEWMSSMDYALLLATEATKSQAVAIPSDRHPETGESLFELGYMTDDKKGEQYIACLKFLSDLTTRSIVMGAMADISKEGGGFNKEEMRWSMTQLDNQMILQMFVSQLSRYHLPKYARYNASDLYIAMLLVGLDPARIDRVFKFLSTAGNQADGGALDWPNWELIFQLSGIPTVSKEEADKIKEDRKAQAEKEEGDEGGEEGGGGTEEKEELEDAIQRILAGDSPVILSGNQLDAIAQKIPGLVWNETTVELANPYHDAQGRFTSKGKAGAGPIAEKGKKKEVKKADARGGGRASQFKSWVKEHDDELKKAGIIAAVGVVAVGGAVIAGTMYSKGMRVNTKWIQTKVDGIDVLLGGVGKAPGAHHLARMKPAIDLVSKNIGKPAVKSIEVVDDFVMATRQVRHGRLRNARTSAAYLLQKMGLGVDGLSFGSKRKGWCEDISIAARASGDPATWVHEIIHTVPQKNLGFRASEGLTDAITSRLTSVRSSGGYPVLRGFYNRKANIEAKKLGIDPMELLKRWLGIGLTTQLGSQQLPEPPDIPQRELWQAAAMSVLRGNADEEELNILWEALEVLAKKTLEEDTIQLSNPYHDELGRFSSKERARTVSEFKYRPGVKLDKRAFESRANRQRKQLTRRLPGTEAPPKIKMTSASVRYLGAHTATRRGGLRPYTEHTIHLPHQTMYRINKEKDGGLGHHTLLHESVHARERAKRPRIGSWQEEGSTELITRKLYRDIYGHDSSLRAYNRYVERVGRAAWQESDGDAKKAWKYVDDVHQGRVKISSWKRMDGEGWETMLGATYKFEETDDLMEQLLDLIEQKKWKEAETLVEAHPDDDSLVFVFGEMWIAEFGIDEETEPTGT